MALNNNSTAQAYASDFASYIDIANKPEYYSKMIQQYGDGLYLMDFMHMAGDVMNISNPELTVIEEGAPERPVTCSIAITAAPLDDVEITFATSDSSDEYVREGFDLMIPATYTDADGTRALRLYESDGTWYGTPYDSTWAITSVITTAEFFLGASSWVRGSGQPDPMATGLYERSFNARLIKDSAGIEGGMLARLDWEPVKDGSGRVTSRLMTEMEFRFNSQVDSVCLLSEENTNTLLTGTSNITGNSSAIGSTAGLLPTMETSAQSQTYSSAYGSTQFDAIKTLLEGQGVTSKNIKFCVGTDLMSTIENDILDWLSTNSAINPLYDGIEKAGFGVQRFKKNGFIFNIVKLDSFSNPNKYGGSEYPYADYGMMFPDQKNTVTDKYGSIMHENETGLGAKNKLSHMSLGYINSNGENRTRVLKTESGMNGMGLPAYNQYDGVKYHLMSEFMNIFVKMNQSVLVTQ